MLSDRAWRGCTTIALLGLIAAGGLALRLPDLGRRPMHVDEAVHTYKFNELWQTGTYRYDLQEYHGPTLYYLTLPAVWLSGAADYVQTTAAMYRGVPVVFAVASILLLLLIADGLGRPAVVCAALPLALSPAMVFYSRYYIQETLLVFFTMLVIAAGWRYVRTRRPGWAILAGVGVGLMHATKETCVIALGSMGVALLITRWWHARPVSAPAHLPSREGPGEGLPPLPLREGPGEGQTVRPSDSDRAIAGPARKGHRGAGSTTQTSVTAAALVCLLAATIVSVVLFSGVFTNVAGPPDSLRAFATYFQRAGGDGVHEHPWHYYLRMLTYWRVGRGPVWSEGLITILALVGIAAALRGRHIGGASLPLLRFLAVYSLLILVTYSAIPYKTPWCILSSLHALILLAGVGAVALVQAARFKLVRVAVALILIAAVAQLGWQARRSISQKYCAYPGNPYVYATTLHGVADLAAQLDRLAAVCPDGRRMLIKVMVENCWPLPWYLRAFERAGYWEAVPDEPDADVILASATLREELEPRLQGAYELSHRGLRRDERLLVYVRRGLWDALLDSLRQNEARPGSDAP